TFRIHEAATGFGYAQMSYTFQRAGAWTDLKATVLRIPQSAGVLFMWLTLPQTILWLAGVALVWRRRVALPGPGPAFLAIYTLTVLAFYCVAIAPAWGYPKYDATLVPLVAILAAWTLTEGVPRAPGRLAGWAVALMVGVFIAQSALIGDPLWEVYRQTLETAIGQLGARLA